MTGRRRGRTEAGFTLIETVVVMAIMGLLLALVTAARPRLGGFRLDATASTVVAGLRAARADALLHGHDALFVVDAAGRRFGPPQRLQPLPADVSLSVTLSAAERDGSVGAFRFYPTGRSSGGSLTLAASGRTDRIDVDWLTGEAGLAP